jgi:hypothetical protein
MYVCVYVPMYVCMYVCVYVRTYLLRICESTDDKSKQSETVNCYENDLCVK